MSRVDAEAVRQTVSLLDLLTEAPKRKTGRDAYVALCAFHEDATPSMSVRLTDRGWQYRCFACGESGGVIDFYMRTRNVDFQQALRDLGADVPSAPTVKKRRRPGFLCVCSECGARAEIDADDLVHLMVYRGPDLGWHLTDARALCPRCVEKRLADPYRGGQQTSFRRAA